MKKTPFLAVVFCLLASRTNAEPRWCSITGLGEGQNLKYVPIARAARVSGVVLERVVYRHSGDVIEFEQISGPMMLRDGLERQMKDWSIKTDAKGDQDCVTLVIAEFELDEDSGESTARPVDLSIPGVLKLGVITNLPHFIYDPAQIGWGPFPINIWRVVKYRIARIFAAKR